MKKIVFAAIAVVLIAAVVIFAHSKANAKKGGIDLDRLESLAEKGDTAAMHRLIEFYDENAVEYVEVAGVIGPDGHVWSAEEVEKQNEENKRRAEMSEKYAERLNYWLDKGIAINDPVALVIKGMRLYYTDEAEATAYLSRAAHAGSAEAALFCGSAYMNMGKGEEAFRYLSLAYELGAPSAGWHLAKCYSAGIGTERDPDKAVEVLRHAADLNCQEAVEELLSLERYNATCHPTSDSLAY